MPQPSKTLALGAALLALYTFLLMQTEGHTWVDALYLSTMTVTTIGYGDICPTTPAGKAVCAAAALSGIGYFGIIFEILRDFRARSLESKVLESVRMKGTAGMLLTTLAAGVLLCYYLRADFPPSRDHWHLKYCE